MVLFMVSLKFKKATLIHLFSKLLSMILQLFGSEMKNSDECRPTKLHYYHN